MHWMFCKKSDFRMKGKRDGMFPPRLPKCLSEIKMSSPMRSGGWAVRAEGAQYFVQVGSDTHLVFEEILEPEVIAAFGQGNEGKQFAQAYPDDGLLALGVVFLDGVGKNPQLRCHGQTSL